MLKLKAIFLALPLVTFGSYAHAQRTMADALCESHQTLARQFIQYRQQGLPIAMARDTVDGVIRTDANLWRFMVKSVNTAYKDPDLLRSMLQDGSWLQRCVEEVRGY